MTLYGRTSLIAAALAAGLAMPAGLSAEVMPQVHPQRPRGLGDWMSRNNRRRVAKAERRPRKSLLNKRLARATGPNSYDQWKLLLMAQRAAKKSQNAT